ncbi:iron complex transport system permease protein [Dyadobacter jejuensis]|uniref:Iron complex transport system permease protein n=1 Tax=Dyadobacter jejuensis TaxID=1082580 RepID=A0A316AGF9_9BACT|nr:iron ABC transporter permease [Dyadobacter jejuensis]PWJ56701.1 iron complex transport system permease protein [Dyadobacter jejuensis]
MLLEQTTSHTVKELPPLKSTDSADAKVTWTLVLLVLLLIATMLLSMGIGAVPIGVSEIGSLILHSLGWTSATEVTEAKAMVFWVIRLPRVVLAVLVGAGLGIAGAALQGLFRNPVADAGLIGVTSGASLFAILIMMLNAQYWSMINEYGGAYVLSLGAFVGAALTTFLVYQLSKLAGDGSAAMILLIGIAINALVGSITGLMTYLANEQQLRSMTFWSLGSLGGANWTSVIAIAPFVLASTVGLPMLGKSLNLLVLGESQAKALGVNIIGLRRMVIVLATLGVGASVAVAGSIGFVGLVVPHIIRNIIGPDHRNLLIGSALGGALVLAIADTISRTIVAPAELPIGIVTALLGSPFFMYILWKQKTKRI